PALQELGIRLWSRASGGRTVSVTDEASGSSLLSWRTSDADGNPVWENLPDDLPFAVTNFPRELRLAVRRSEFASTEYATVLSVRDGAGTRYEVPVTAEAFADPSGNPFAGLWVGIASITEVSQVSSAGATDPVPAGSEFNLRLLIHVSTNGQAR